VTSFELKLRPTQKYFSLFIFSQEKKIFLSRENRGGGIRTIKSETLDEKKRTPCFQVLLPETLLLHRDVMGSNRGPGTIISTKRYGTPVPDYTCCVLSMLKISFSNKDTLHSIAIVPTRILP